MNRQPMPVLDALSQPGRHVWLPPKTKGEASRRQGGREFVQQMLIDDDVRRLWVGVIPDVKALLPEQLIRRAKKVYSLDDDDADIAIGNEAVNSLGPQRLPFPQLWIEFAVPDGDNDYAPLAAYTMETDYGYGVAFFRLMPNGHVATTNLVEQVEIDPTTGAVISMSASWAVDGMQGDEVEDEDELSMLHVTLPVMWAVGLMNCRNVTTVEVAPRNRSSKKQRRKRKPGLSYHTIVLPSIRTAANRENDPSTGSLSDQPLHMVRGHTKTYTADAPLLGKHVGTYWWGYQVRGNKENGQIISDYQMTS